MYHLPVGHLHKFNSHTLAPHIGHLYSAVIADTINRFERLINPSREFLFSTGTDEHGTKIQQAAALNNVTPREYCDTISNKYRMLFEEASVIPTRFIRTTDGDHQVAVQNFWVNFCFLHFFFEKN